MTGWQAQAMWEAQTAMIWEAMNAPDPNEGRYAEAEKDIEVAQRHLRKAIEWLQQAAEKVHGLPMENKVESFVDQLENFNVDLGFLQEKH